MLGGRRQVYKPHRRTAHIQTLTSCGNYSLALHRARLSTKLLHKHDSCPTSKHPHRTLQQHSDSLYKYQLNLREVTEPVETRHLNPTKSSTSTPFTQTRKHKEPLEILTSQLVSIFEEGAGGALGPSLSGTSALGSRVTISQRVLEGC